MSGQRNVVPFERTAAYWRFHARRHDTPDQRPAAAKMLRKALEKTGDPATALELSRVYMDMGCFTASERLLARAVARGGLTGQACFLMGCCALNRGEMTLAEDAFDCCQRVGPDSEWADRAQDMLETVPWPAYRPARGQARGEIYCRRAREALWMGRADQARSLADRAWERGKSAQAAMLMGATREAKDALSCFRRAVRKTPDALQPRLLFAVAAYQAGEKARALAEMSVARRLCRTITDFEELCAAAWESGASAIALAAVTEQLEAAPASIDFLRLKYLCLKRLNDDAGARRTLETLLDIDPDDAAGLWYRRHPEDQTLYEGRRVLLTALGCQLRAVPERLRRGRLNRLLHYLTMALRSDVDAETVYRLVVPLWRRMPEAEKRRCDEGSRHGPLCLALYVLIAAGKKEQADALYRSAPCGKRIRRTLRRYAQWNTEKERSTDALHQFRPGI